MNGDVTLTAGLIGSALHIPDNQAYIDYGYHNGSCFANPRMCYNGVTMSMWLKFPQNAVEGDIVDTGSRSFAYGYNIGMKRSALKISVKDDRDYLYKMTTPVAHNKWFHVVMTYMSSVGIQLFLNGCDADVDGKHGYASDKDRRREFERFFPFVFGRRKSSSYAVQNLMLDEFIMWHQKLSGSHIWEIYRRGGNL